METLPKPLSFQVEETLFPELNVADGIPSTEIIFVLHLQSPGLQAGYRDRVTDS